MSDPIKLETTKYYHPLVYCSFCHKKILEKEPIILGPDVSMCYECLEEAAKKLTPPWTSKSPTEPGWYWWRDKDCKPRIKQIEYRDISQK
jgi:hypothetical protein